MTTALQFAVLGLGIGAIYALLAQGVVAVYRGSGVLNFAQGAVAMVGAFVFLQLREVEGWSLPLALGVTIVAAALLGAVIHLGLMKPLQSASNLQRVIATLGVLLVLQSGAALIWGTTSRFTTSELPSDVRELGPVTVGEDRMWLVGIATLITGLLWAIARFTRFGLATTAAAENRRAASALAWSPDRIATINWALGSALGAIAGILIAPLTGVQAETMTMLIIPAIAAALVGGFSSYPVTLVGALAIGVAQSLAGNYITQQGVAQSLPFFILVLVLIFRGNSLPIRGEVKEKLPLVGSGRIRPSVVLGLSALLLVLMYAWFSAAFIDALTVSLIVALAMLSIVVLVGYTGQLSLGQAALGGIGATVAARLVKDVGAPFAVALVAGIVVAVVLGLIFALPALRTRGVQLAAVTLGLGLAVDTMVLKNAELTGGTDGTFVGEQSLFGVNIDSVSHPARYGTIALVGFVLLAVAVANLRRGRAGRRLIAVRSNERAAAALGISVSGAKLYAFSLAAGIAGLAGVLLAFKAQTVTYGYFTPIQSILTVAYTVIGGVGFVIGPLFGSLLASGGVGTYVGDIIFASLEDYVALIGGVMLLLILLTQPHGIAIANIEGVRALKRAVSRLRGMVEPKTATVTRRAAERRRVEPRTLHVEGVSVEFGGVRALSNTGIHIEPGQVVGLIGPNGAGKTTFIDVVTGFVRPVEGDVALDGRSITRDSVARRARGGMSRSFQSLELFEDVSVLENLRAASDSRDRLAYVWNLFSGKSEKLHSAAIVAIEEFDLWDDLEKLPSELSYGRRRLVAVARAVAMEPSILLLDEPASGLDSTERSELADLVRRLADKWGIGVLLVEHDMDFVMKTCDRLTVLNFGEVIAEGTVGEVRADPVVRDAYLGVASEPVQAAPVQQDPFATGVTP